MIRLGNDFDSCTRVNEFLLTFSLILRKKEKKILNQIRVPTEVN